MLTNVKAQVPGSTSERHASWLELFFDLVFVLAIAELARYLHDHLTVSGFLSFVFLWVPVWWIWSGYSYFGDLFTVDTPAYRVTMLTAMLLSIAVAVNVSTALDGGSAGFALAYIALRIVLVGLYAWSWFRVREARALSSRYVAGFALGAAMWTGSLVVAEPARYWVWGLGLAIEIATPIVAQLEVLRSAPVQRSHLPERFGLFTLVVLGESIVVTGVGVADTDWTARSVLVAALSFTVVGCAWWLYFDHVDERAFERAASGGVRALLNGFLWAYGHLLTYIGLTAMAVGIELAIDQAAEPALPGGTRAALCGGVMLYLLSLLMLQTRMPIGHQRSIVAARLLVVAVALLLAIGGGWFHPVAVLVALTVSTVGLLTFETTRIAAAAPSPATAPPTPYA